MSVYEVDSFFRHSELSLLITLWEPPVSFKGEGLFIEGALVEDLVLSDVLFEELESGVSFWEGSIKGEFTDFIGSSGFDFSSEHHLNSCSLDVHVVPGAELFVLWMPFGHFIYCVYRFKDCLTD